MIRGHRYPRRDSGQVAVIAGLALVALVAITGLSVDVGRDFVDQRALQAGTDTASTAGATMLRQDYNACISTPPSQTPATLPFSSAAIDSAVLGQVASATAEQGHATGAPVVNFVDVTSATSYSIVSPVASYSASLCSYNSADEAWEWSGPTGVETGASDQHGTTLLRLIGITSATETAKSVAVFGLVDEATYAPFTAWYLDCGLSGTPPLAVGDSVTLEGTNWATQDTCGPNAVAGSSNFKGLLTSPTPDPIAVPGTGGSLTGSGSSCSSWPSSVGVGQTVTVPVIDSLVGTGSGYSFHALGVATIQITTSNCPSALVGTVVNPTGPNSGYGVCLVVRSSSCPWNAPGGMTFVELFQ